MARHPVDIPGPLGQRARGRRRYRWHREVRPLIALLGGVLPRLFDLLAALVVLLATSPLLLVRLAWSLAQCGRAIDASTLIGRFRTPFRRLAFSGSGPLRGLAVWINVLRGDMAIVGPRPLSEAEAAAVPVTDLVRFAVRPGLVSPFGLRRRVGIAHVSESALDRDYAYAQTLAGDMGITARSVVAGVLGGGDAPRATPPRLNFFGVPVLNTTMAEAVRWVIDGSGRGQGCTMAFVNPDCLNIAWNDPRYKAVLLHATRVLPDGIGIHIGCRMLGQALRENVNGTDMFPLLCEAAAAAGRSIYLLGARPGIALAAADRMRARFPALRVAGARDGYFRSEEEPAVIDAINGSGADILLVAFGVPRQELWLSKHRDALRPGVCMGVGGLFDFYSGRIPRAPVWMREIGLEWVYRLIQEPGRMWRRYVIGNPLFLFRVWRQSTEPGRFALPAGAVVAAGDNSSESMR